MSVKSIQQKMPAFSLQLRIGRTVIAHHLLPFVLLETDSIRIVTGESIVKPYIELNDIRQSLPGVFGLLQKARILKKYQFVRADDSKQNVTCRHIMFIAGFWSLLQ